MRTTALRLLLAGTATAASLLTAPAQADDTGMFNRSVGNCGYERRQVCLGYGQGVPVGLRSLAVELNCSAATPFVVDRTGVGCYLVGISDQRVYLRTGPVFLAGNEAAISNAGTVPFQGYYLCVGAGYSTATGEFQPVQNHWCE
ncbi:MAG TPA: hypothetical protein VNA20_04890 [Frankiaceae bacterium]|nr:hypothetical protein [Frankiaceae bacterium]